MAVMAAANAWAGASAAGQGKVLLLQSYHPGYAWSDGIADGVREVVAKSSLSLDVEYLDSKHYAPETVFPGMLDLLFRKYAGKQPAAILAADKNAFAFMRRYRKLLFPGVPLAFCGVEHVPERVVQQLQPLTGVQETPPWRRNLQLIQQLHPQVQQVVAIGDNTSTSRVNLKQLQQAYNQLSPAYSLQTWSGLTSQRLARKLQTLPDHAVLLYASLMRTADQRTFEPREGVAFILQQRQLPVYGCWDFMLHTGAVGGAILKAPQQGRLAAEMLSKLRQNPQSPLPVRRQSPVTYIFDYQALQRFDIAASRLPAGAHVVNKPLSWTQQHHQLLPWFLLLSGCLALAVIALALRLLWRRRLNAAVQESEQRWLLALEGSRQGVWDWQVQQGLVYYSPQWQAQVGLPAEAVAGSLDHWRQYLHPQDAARVEEALHAYVAGDQPEFQCEYRLCHEEDSYIWVLARGQIMARDDQGKPQRMLGTQTDITLQKQAQARVEQLLYGDELTGLYSRLGLQQQLQHYLEQGTDQQQAGLLLLLDLDEFHAVNQSLGYEVGNDILQEVAGRLQNNPQLLVARLDADTFGLLLPPIYSQRQEVLEQGASLAAWVRQQLQRPFSGAGFNLTFRCKIVSVTQAPSRD